MLLFQIFTRSLPYQFEVEGGNYSFAEVMTLKFQHRSIELPTTMEMIPNSIKTWIRRCITLDTSLDLTVMAKQLKGERPLKKGIVDVMMDTMESYMETLEKKVEERTGELMVMTGKMRELLDEVLPPQIASKLLRGEQVKPEMYESISVYFSDIVGFTTLSSMSTPLEVMEFLNELWKVFDATIQRFDAYKVDTIGDAYMVCSGLPTRNGVEHVRQIGLLSIALLDVVSKFKIRHKPDQKLKVRIGVNSGPATTGIVGTKMPQYCVFGDTVNTGSPMQIQCSDTTHMLMTQYFPEFKLEMRGVIDVKGKGSMTTYWLIPPNEQRK